MKNRLLIPFDGWTSPMQGVTVPPFEGDAAARAFIVNRVSKDYAQLDIEVTDKNDPNDTRPTAIVAVGGGSATQGGSAIVGGFRRQGITNDAVVYANNFLGNLIWIAKAISHEAGHLFGLYDLVLWVNGAMAGPYRLDGAIMGSYILPDGVEPFWTVGKTAAGTDQDDAVKLTAVLGKASPTPIPLPIPDPMDDTTKATIQTVIASLTALLTPTTPPDVTRITAPNGKITAPDGTVFSFGGPAAGGYAILVNGSPLGGAVSLGIKGGTVYAFNDRGNWWKWTGTNWKLLTFDPFA